ncbi:hypothetical protein WPG_3348 [Winogradskyella sp. PG-2]|nr:hypothetical protein WPG_3348 [Winogradskyella sp. PG-2]
MNDNINSQFSFDDSNISFFTHFPDLTLSFENVTIQGNAPFSETSLIKAKELSFGVNIFRLIFSRAIEVNKTYVTDSEIEIIKDQFSRVNYNIAKTADNIEEEIEANSNIDLSFEGLVLTNTSIIYRNLENGVTVYSKGVNYDGDLKLLERKLELGSKLTIDNIDLVFDKIEYLKGKKLRAKSFTVYDTKNLSVELDKNSIWINGLDLDFEGLLNIFEDGIAYDLNFKTNNGDFKKLASALPPKYVEWSKDLKVLKGNLNADLHLISSVGNVPSEYRKEEAILDLEITEGAITHNTSEYNLENLLIKIQGRFKPNCFNVKVDTLSFTIDDEKSYGNLYLDGSSDSLFIKYSITSKVNLDKLNKALTLPNVKFSGVLESDWMTEGVYQPKTSKFPKSKGYFTLKDGTLLTARHPEPLKNINISAKIKNDGDSYASSTLDIDTLSFSFLNNPFKAKGKFQDFDNLKYNIQAKGKIDFTTLNKAIALPFLFSEGKMDSNISMVGQLNDTSQEKKHSGTLKLQNINLESDALQQPLYIDEGNFIFLNDRVGFTDLKVHYGRSNATLNGHFKDYLKYFLYKKDVLRGDLDLYSKKIDITEFFPKVEVIQTNSDSLTTAYTKAGVTNGVLQVPSNLDISLGLNIDSLQYNSLEISKLTGNLGINNRALILKKGQLNMVDGSAKLEGAYNALSPEKALFSMKIKAQNLNIKKAYNSMVLFEELLPAAEKASGSISTNYELSGTLNKEMIPELRSLKGGGELTGSNIQFEDYKLMGRLSKKSGFNALNDPKVSEIKIKSTIESNVLELERFKFKVRPFRLRTEGQIALDGELSLKMRIGLPPFGIIGIPVTVKGPSDDFKIKLGKKTKDLKAVDAEDPDYTDEDLFRLNMLKDSIREGMTLKEITAMEEHINNITPNDPIRLNDIWLLESVWINGEEVEIAQYTFEKGNPVLEINIRNMSFLGHEGCNNIIGEVLIIALGKITFGPVTSTDMMCPNPELTKAYIENLGQVNRYTYEQLQLTLYKDEIPLLKFKKN